MIHCQAADTVLQVRGERRSASGHDDQAAPTASGLAVARSSYSKSAARAGRPVATAIKTPKAAPTASGLQEADSGVPLMADGACG